MAAWLGPHKGQNFGEKKKKKKKKIFSETVKWMNPVLCIRVPDSSFYIICVFLFQSDKNSGCYGFQKLKMGKVEISYFEWTNCRYLNFVFAEIFIEYISMFHVTFS